MNGTCRAPRPPSLRCLSEGRAAAVGRFARFLERSGCFVFGRFNHIKCGDSCRDNDLIETEVSYLYKSIDSPLHRMSMPCRTCILIKSRNSQGFSVFLSHSRSKCSIWWGCCSIPCPQKLTTPPVLLLLGMGS